MSFQQGNSKMNLQRATEAEPDSIALGIENFRLFLRRSREHPFRVIWLFGDEFHLVVAHETLWNDLRQLGPLNGWNRFYRFIYAIKSYNQASIHVSACCGPCLRGSKSPTSLVSG